MTNTYEYVENTKCPNSTNKPHIPKQKLIIYTTLLLVVHG